MAQVPLSCLHHSPSPLSFLPVSLLAFIPPPFTAMPQLVNAVRRCCCCCLSQAPQVVPHAHHREMQERWEEGEGGGVPRVACASDSFWLFVRCASAALQVGKLAVTSWPVWPL